MEVRDRLEEDDVQQYIPVNPRNGGKQHTMNRDIGC
jgi:hypothetical protein